MPNIKLALADDHILFLDGLIALLSRENDLDIIFTAKNGNELLAFLDKNSVDVAIIDLNMPECDGLATMREIRKREIAIRTIILTTYDDIELIREMKNLEVDGYILKNSTTAELVTAIHEVMRGEKYFSRLVQKKMLEDHEASRLQDERAKESKLTAREIEIIRLLAKEMTNDAIADELVISFRTVETHRKNIMAKTNSKNLAGLIQFAVASGIIK
jgi:DNA-binding NarL/FixJ family response regulator